MIRSRCGDNVPIYMNCLGDLKYAFGFDFIKSLKNFIKFKAQFMVYYVFCITLKSFNDNKHLRFN